VWGGGQGQRDERQAVVASILAGHPHAPTCTPPIHPQPAPLNPAVGFLCMPLTLAFVREHNHSGVRLRLRLRVLCALQLVLDQADMAKDFAAFRTRLLGAWLICNLFYVAAILHFGFLREYGLGLAVMIFWSLFFRMIGE
jgi:hypothetical protein